MSLAHSYKVVEIRTMVSSSIDMTFSVEFVSTQAWTETRHLLELHDGRHLIHGGVKDLGLALNLESNS